MAKIDLFIERATGSRTNLDSNSDRERDKYNNLVAGK